MQRKKININVRLNISLTKKKKRKKSIIFYKNATIMLQFPGVKNAFQDSLI